MRKWNSTKHLAEMILAKAEARKNVTLTPDTAMYIALNLERIAAKPTREEVALLLCTSKTPCEDLCINCIGRANAVVRVYGQRLE